MSRRAPLRRSSVRGSETSAGAASETTLSLLMCGVLLLPKPFLANSISAETRRTTQLTRTPDPTIAHRGRGSGPEYWQVDGRRSQVCRYLVRWPNSSTERFPRARSPQSVKRRWAGGWESRRPVTIPPQSGRRNGSRTRCAPAARTTAPRAGRAARRAAPGRATSSWRRLRGFRQLGKVIEGVTFNDGIAVTEDRAAA